MLIMGRNLFLLLCFHLIGTKSESTQSRESKIVSTTWKRVEKFARESKTSASRSSASKAKSYRDSRISALPINTKQTSPKRESAETWDEE